MAALEELTTIRDQVIARMKAITESPKPTYSIDGESYSWESYFSMLSNQVKTIEESMQRASGPSFMFKSRGRP